MITEKELLELKEDMETAKTTISELNGQLKVLTKQLKDNFGCATIEEAEKKSKKIENDRDNLLEKIASLSKELEDKYVNEDSDE